MNRIKFTVGLMIVATHLASFASDPLDQWFWRNPLPNGNVPIVLTYANGTFVGVGDEGLVASSADGTNWVSQVLGPIYGAGIEYGLWGIAWGNGTWVAVGLGENHGWGAVTSLSS
ncbi:MAG: hypothetical protein ACLQVY_18115 [Limisphaerales bacterium]